MQQFEIDLTKAKKIIIQTDDGIVEAQHTQPSGGQQQTPPQTQYPQGNGAQYTSNQAKTDYKKDDKSQPMSKDNIQRLLQQKLLDGDVNGETFKKAKGWAYNIANNPTLSNPEKAGFLTSIDVKFGTNFLKDFEAQHQNDDYIPFPD